MRLKKLFPLLLAVLFLSNGCSSKKVDELSRQNEELRKKVEELEAKVEKKDEAVELKTRAEAEKIEDMVVYYDYPGENDYSEYNKIMLSENNIEVKVGQNLVLKPHKRAKEMYDLYSDLGITYNDNGNDTPIARLFEEPHKITDGVMTFTAKNPGRTSIRVIQAHNYPIFACFRVNVLDEQGKSTVPNIGVVEEYISRNEVPIQSAFSKGESIYLDEVWQEGADSFIRGSCVTPIDTANGGIFDDRHCWAISDRVVIEFDDRDRFFVVYASSEKYDDKITSLRFEGEDLIISMSNGSEIHYTDGNRLEKRNSEFAKIDLEPGYQDNRGPEEKSSDENIVDKGRTDRSSLALEEALLGHWVRDTQYEYITKKGDNPEKVEMLGPSKTDMYFSKDKVIVIIRDIVREEYYYTIDAAHDNFVSIEGFDSGSNYFFFPPDKNSFTYVWDNSDLRTGRIEMTKEQFRYVDSKQNP